MTKINLQKWGLYYDKFLEKNFNFALIYSKEDIEAIYAPDTEKLALGLYWEEINIGFLSVAIFKDKIGGIYNIYIRFACTENENIHKSIVTWKLINYKEDFDLILLFFLQFYTNISVGIVLWG